MCLYLRELDIVVLHVLAEGGLPVLEPKLVDYQPVADLHQLVADLHLVGQVVPDLRQEGALVDDIKQRQGHGSTLGQVRQLGQEPDDVQTVLLPALVLQQLVRVDCCDGRVLGATQQAPQFPHTVLFVLEQAQVQADEVLGGLEDGDAEYAHGCLANGEVYKYIG